MLSLQSVGLPQWDVPGTPHQSRVQEASGSESSSDEKAFHHISKEETSYQMLGLTPDPERALQPFLAENHVLRFGDA